MEASLRWVNWRGGAPLDQPLWVEAPFTHITHHYFCHSNCLLYTLLSKNSGSGGPLLLLIKVLLIISLAGLLYIPGCINNKCIKSSTYADTWRYPHTDVREQTHTHPDKGIMTCSYVSFPWQYCVFSTSSKMQMNLALLTQVHLPFYHADICPGWPLQRNSSHLLAVFLLRVRSWGQTFSICSEINTRNQRLLHQQTDTCLKKKKNSQSFCT